MRQFMFFFAYEDLEMLYVIYPYSTSQFRLAASQVPSSHVWPRAAVLSSAAVEG